MLAHVVGPVDHGILEPGQVAGEQRARGFLEPGRVAGDGVHEAIGRFLALAALVAATVAARGPDEASQRHRGAAGLGVEPGPVPRQQRDLARDDPELGPAAAARHGRRVNRRFGRLRGRRGGRGGRAPLHQVGHGSAQVDLDLALLEVVEDQDPGVRVGVQRLAGTQGHAAQRADGDQAVAGEGRDPGGKRMGGVHRGRPGAGGRPAYYLPRVIFKRQRGLAGSRLWTAVAAIAAWPTATAIWLSALTTSPMAYRPSMLACRWASVCSAPSSSTAAPSSRASSDRASLPSTGYRVSYSRELPSSKATVQEAASQRSPRVEAASMASTRREKVRRKSACRVASAAGPSTPMRSSVAS